MRSRAAALALVVGALAVVAACGGAPHAAPPSRTPSATASPSPSPSPSPVITAPAGTPLGAGQRVWAAFSARGLPYASWWAQLKPLLSDSARAVYVYDDPRNLPAMSVTGQIRVAAKAPDEPHFTVEVIVPTSKGTFALDLERHTLKSPWLLYAIKFPPTVR